MWLCTGIGVPPPFTAAHWPGALQKPWIPRGSLASCIAFTDSQTVTSLDSAWMDTVINACGMSSDVARFVGGIHCDVGEAGSREHLNWT